MTKADALIELREKVEAGDCDYDLAWRYFVSRDMSGAQWATRFREAFCGSLDAAKALHEAVLPGWDGSVHTYGIAQVRLRDDRGDVRNTIIGEFPNCPARAWLLAILDVLIKLEILDALIKQEKSTDDQN